MPGIQDELDKLSKEAEEKKTEANRLVRLSAEFPDLRKHVGRWNKVAYCSASVNSQVGRFELRHNCGCCPDSPLELWPYLETPNGNVYTDPPCFQIGEKYYLGGDRPYPGWDEKLKAAGIPEIIIGAVGFHFKQCKEARIKEAYESDEVPEESEPFV
jgi:hypothetical protein